MKPPPRLFGAILGLGIGLVQISSVSVRAGNIVMVPVRWCVVAGTPAVTNPGAVGAANTDQVLEDRLKRLSDKIWCPQALVVFRSAMTADVTDPNDRHFPIITGSTGSADEIAALYAAGEKAWNDLGTKYHVNFSGPLVINVPGNGSCFGNGGYTHTTVVAGGNVCTDPTKFESAYGGHAIIADNQTMCTARYFDFATADEVLAHELGHILKLNHGNGLDDSSPANGLYESPMDFNCDSAENPTDDLDSPLNNPPTLMRPHNNNKLITSLQAATAKNVARVYAGAHTDPPGVLLPGDAVQNERIDTVKEVTDSSIDILAAGMVENTVQQTTVIYHRTFGAIPFLPTGKEYIMFLDLDNNPTTGGAPSTLGFPTDFQGAELVTRVVAFQSGEFPLVDATVWKFQGGAFVQVIDPSIFGRVNSPVEGETGQPLFYGVELLMANSVRGALAPGRTFRIQAIAHGLESGGQLDQLPDSPASGAVSLFMERPVFPVCALTPGNARPGTMVHVQASGLVPNETGNVFLGDKLIGSGTIDASGNFSLDVLIPEDSEMGPRLVTTSVGGTAISSACPLVLSGRVNHVPTITCESSVTNECVSPTGATETLTVQVVDADGEALTVVWQVNGVPVQTNSIAAGGPPTSASVSLVDFLYPLGTNTVLVTVSDGLAFRSGETTVLIGDITPPLVACRAAPNPGDKKIPVSGKNPSSGQNPDGYYQLLAKDNCQAAPQIFVHDTGSSFVAGPFNSGDVVKLMQNPGGTPSSDPGTPPIVANIHLNGDALIYAVDAYGNVSPEPCSAKIPPKPK